jgi:NAD(P)H-hydrate epimerase
MEPVLTPDEMRAADEATIAGGVPQEELMDRAAYACAVTALRMLGGAYGKRVVVAAGKGNNGGDGVVCAQHLSARGVHATVIRTDDWSADAFERATRDADLVIDALLGTGSSGAPRTEVAAAIAAVNACPAPVLAIDMPSGVSGADGSVPGEAVYADVTVAIQALKIGHVVTPGALRCGRVVVADIGIALADARVFVPQGADVLRVLPALEPDTHKYKVGALGVIAGSAGMTGAAILTALGAIRSGAGLVVVGVPASTLEIFEVAVTEAIKVPLPEAEGQLEAKAVDEMADRLERCRALAVGPGLGRGPRAVGQILEEEPGVLEARSHPSILTPHDGEFSYLSGHAPGTNRVGAVVDLSARIGAVVHLKGRRAITASPDGAAWVNTSGNPGQATGGSGDVLTGIVASLVAQGAPAPEATWAGAYLHGLAVDVVAARTGRRPLAARDIPDAYAHALRLVERPRGTTLRLRTVVEPAT